MPPAKDIFINTFQLPGLGLPIIATAGSRSADALGSIGLGLTALGFSGMCVCAYVPHTLDALTGKHTSLRWSLYGAGVALAGVLVLSALPVPRTIARLD
jgi:hypothetical protein